MYCGETYFGEEVAGDAEDKEEDGGVRGEGWNLSRVVISGDRGTDLRAILHTPRLN